jgi:hypothetical protein
MFLLAVVCCLFALAPSQVLADDTQTTGLFFNRGAYPGYNLFGPYRAYTTYLMDNDGNFVHKWVDPNRHSAGASAYLTKRGTLLRACYVDTDYDPANPGRGAGKGGLIREYAWHPDKNGNAVIVWQYRYNTANLLQHHDFFPLQNGNILIIAREKSAAHKGDWERIIEVKPDRSSYHKDTKTLPPHGVGGKIVWEWRLLDHLVPVGEDPADYPERWDPALPAPRINALDYSPRLNQLLMSAGDEIWVIDRSTTTEEAAGHEGGDYGKGGDLLYRWGNPKTYLGNDTYPQMSFFQHGARWIRPRMFGYHLSGQAVGNVLFFNNQAPNPVGPPGRVDEFTPPLKSDGSYEQPAYGEAFGPQTLAWSLPLSAAGMPPGPFLGSAQRLPNGNTLINSGPTGTMVEVDEDGDPVWKFVNPAINRSPVGPTPRPFDDEILGPYDTVPVVGGPTNMVFRVTRYAPHFAGLRGRIKNTK